MLSYLDVLVLVTDNAVIEPTLVELHLQFVNVVAVVKLCHQHLLDLFSKESRNISKRGREETLQREGE